MLQGGKCFYCGNKLALENATIDHILAKALGGDNSEANTVVCCRAVNQAFGNATPKEKLSAIIAAGGRIECPKKEIEPVALAAQAVISSPPNEVQLSFPPLRSQSNAPSAKGVAEQSTKKNQPRQKSSPEIKPSQLRKPLQDAFLAAAAVNGGEKALLTAVSLELRKKVTGFVVKRYGEKTFARLVSVLGYRIEKNWCWPPKRPGHSNESHSASGQRG